MVGKSLGHGQRCLLSQVTERLRPLSVDYMRKPRGRLTRESQPQLRERRAMTSEQHLDVLNVFCCVAMPPKALELGKVKNALTILPLRIQQSWKRYQR